MFRALILGAPASGKGTISSRIVKHFDLVHLSSGDLLRAQIQKKTQLGVLADNYVRDGKLVPDDLMIKVIMTELKDIATKNWLLDGFPRTRSQAEALLKEHNVHMAIALNVPEDVIIDRVKGRWVHVASGRVYNETYNKPKVRGKDDVTGEPLEQRPDDAPEAVRKRLRLYTQTVHPLLTLFQQQGILQTFSGKTSDEIWPNVRQVIETNMTESLKLKQN